MKTVYVGVAVAVLCGSVWAADYELKVDKAAYAPGETVTLKFYNNSSGTVELGKGSPTVYDKSGKGVYSPTFPFAVSVAPGTVHPNYEWEHGWNWDLVYNSYPPGKYTARIDVLPDDGGPTVVETSFAISEPVVPGTCTLTTDKPVYPVEVWDNVEEQEEPWNPLGGTVTIRVANTTSVAVQLPAPAWKVRDEKGTVIKQAWNGLPGATTIPPNASKAFLWNKTGANSQPVKAGSYMIEVGPIWLDGKGVTLKHRIALTDTGRIAGTSLFPLSMGNEWRYGNQPEVMKITGSMVQSGSAWYKTSGFPLGYIDRIILVGKKKPILRVHHKWAGEITDAFWFGHPLGYSQKAPLFGEVPSLGESPGMVASIQVGATDETVVTPAGTFQGCYRLNVNHLFINDIALDKFWFARGIGMIQYSRFSWGRISVYPLQSVTIKGIDGKVYTIGTE